MADGSEVVFGGAFAWCSSWFLEGWLPAPGDGLLALGCSLKGGGVVFAMGVVVGGRAFWAFGSVGGGGGYWSKGIGTMLSPIGGGTAGRVLDCPSCGAVCMDAVILSAVRAAWRRRRMAFGVALSFGRVSGDVPPVNGALAKLLSPDAREVGWPMRVGLGGWAVTGWRFPWCHRYYAWVNCSICGLSGVHVSAL